MGDTISLQRIQQSLNSLEDLHAETLDFEIKNHEITIKTLTGPELEKIYEQTMDLFDKAREQENSFLMGAWLDAFKLETMAYSLIRIDDVNLKGVKFVDMGDDGKIQKHVFVRNMLKEWDTAVITVCFKKFKELTDIAEERAKEGIEFEDNDQQTRIETLQQELEEARAEQQKEETEKILEDTNPYRNMSQEDLRSAVFSDMESKSSSPFKQKAQEERPVEYVDEEGEPLSEDQVQVIQEAEQRLQKKQEEMNDAAAKKAAKKKPRQREQLNEKNPEIRKPAPKDSASQPTVTHRTNRKRKEDLPMAPGYEDYQPGVLSPKEEEAQEQEEQPQQDPTVNPNFHNPNGS